MGMQVGMGVLRQAPSVEVSRLGFERGRAGPYLPVVLVNSSAASAPAECLRPVIAPLNGVLWTRMAGPEKYAKERLRNCLFATMNGNIEAG